MVRVQLKNTFYYGNPKRRYGPGFVDVPEGLAAALGIAPPVEVAPAPTPKKKPAKAGAG